MSCKERNKERKPKQTEPCGHYIYVIDNIYIVFIFVVIFLSNILISKKQMDSQKRTKKEQHIHEKIIRT